MDDHVYIYSIAINQPYGLIDYTHKNAKSVGMVTTLPYDFALNGQSTRNAKSTGDILHRLLGKL